MFLEDVWVRADSTYRGDNGFGFSDEPDRWDEFVRHTSELCPIDQLRDSKNEHQRIRRAPLTAKSKGFGSSLPSPARVCHAWATRP